MILTAHIDDFTNISAAHREELRELLHKKGLPLSVTESHIVISADLNHDCAAVIHFNDKLLTPYLKEHLPNVHTRIRISDGGPNHLKLADLALHTSKQKARAVSPVLPVCAPARLGWQVPSLDTDNAGKVRGGCPISGSPGIGLCVSGWYLPANSPFALSLIHI